MADTERSDMTEQGDAAPMTPAGPAMTADDTREEQAPATIARREDAREQAGTEAPVVPSAQNPQVPAGAIPEGGPAQAAGDLLADRRDRPEDVNPGGDAPRAT